MTGFGRMLRAEWVKFRTVPGWPVALATVVLALVGLGLAPGMQGTCGTRGPGSECTPPTGPGGEQVTDSLTFVHRPLTGDGTLTVRLTAMTGLLPRPDAGDPGATRAGLSPWAKAGIIVRAGTRPGAPYAAVLMTGAHGIRMQHNYTHDRAGKADGARPGTPGGCG